MEYNNIRSKMKTLLEHELCWIDGKKFIPSNKDGKGFIAPNGQKDCISYETIRLWLTQQSVPKDDTISSMCNFFNTHLRIRIDGKLISVPLAPVHFSDNTLYEDFCQYIGATPNTNEFTSWYEEGEMLSEYLHKKATNMKYDADSLRGLYHVYRRAVNGHGITRMALAIHGTAPISSRRSEPNFFIPCQLYVPSNTNTHSFTYTGVITERYRVTTILLRQNEGNLRDTISIMTSLGDQDRVDVQRIGYMLTTKQSIYTAPINFGIVIRRCSDDFTIEECRTFLRDTPIKKIDSDQDLQDIMRNLTINELLLS